MQLQQSLFSQADNERRPPCCFVACLPKARRSHCAGIARRLGPQQITVAMRGGHAERPEHVLGNPFPRPGQQAHIQRTCWMPDGLGRCLALRHCNHTAARLRESARAPRPSSRAATAVSAPVLTRIVLGSAAARSFYHQPPVPPHPHTHTHMAPSLRIAAAAAVAAASMVVVNARARARSAYTSTVGDGWPMAGHDAARTFVSTFPGPRGPNVALAANISTPTACTSLALAQVRGREVGVCGTSSSDKVYAIDTAAQAVTFAFSPWAASSSQSLPAIDSAAGTFWAGAPGLLYQVNASRPTRLLQMRSGSTFSDVVLGGPGLIVTTSIPLAIIGAALDGTIIYNVTSMDGSSVTAPTVDVGGGRGYVMTSAGVVYAFDAGSGNLIWNYQVSTSGGGGSQSPNPVVSAASGVLLVQSDGGITALTLDTGDLVCTAAVYPSSMALFPTVLVVYGGCPGITAYAPCLTGINPATCAIMWSVPMSNGGAALAGDSSGVAYVAQQLPPASAVSYIAGIVADTGAVLFNVTYNVTVYDLVIGGGATPTLWALVASTVYPYQPGVWAVVDA